MGSLRLGSRVDPAPQGEQLPSPGHVGRGRGGAVGRAVGGLWGGRGQGRGGAVGGLGQTLPLLPLLRADFLQLSNVSDCQEMGQELWGIQSEVNWGCGARFP